MAKPLKVTICGGGKSAHVMSVLAASQAEMEVAVLTLYKDEAERWTKAIESDNMILTIKGLNGYSRDVQAKPGIVSNDPKEIVPGSDIVFFTVAAFAHEEYMKAIAEHLDKKTVLVGFPGQAGFEYMCRSYLGDLCDQITIMNFELSPWVSNMVEYGRKVELTRISKDLSGSILRGKAIPRKPALMSVQMIVGNEPMLKQVKHFAELIFASYSFMHPAIVYGKWKDWDGKAMENEPLFYEEIDDDTTQLIENCSKEYQDVAHAISGQRPDVDFSEFKDIYKWLLDFYKTDCENATSLQNAIKTNKYYMGVKHVMVKEKNKFKPDFNCRYLKEDIPCGVAVVKGIADIVNIETPNCDKLIEWAQGKLSKKYLVDGKLTGLDVKETRSPQRFGFTTVEGILSGKKSET